MLFNVGWLAVQKNFVVILLALVVVSNFIKVFQLTTLWWWWWADIGLLEYFNNENKHITRVLITIRNLYKIFKKTDKN